MNQTIGGHEFYTHKIEKLSSIISEHYQLVHTNPSKWLFPNQAQMAFSQFSISLEKIFSSIILSHWLLQKTQMKSKYKWGHCKLTSTSSETYLFGIKNFSFISLFLCNNQYFKCKKDNSILNEFSNHCLEYDVINSF